MTGEEVWMVGCLIGIGLGAGALYGGDIIIRSSVPNQSPEDSPALKAKLTKKFSAFSAYIEKHARPFAAVCWIVIVGSVACLAWIYPQWATRHLKKVACTVSVQADGGKAHFEALRDVLKAESDIRLSVVQAFGGLLLLGGLYFTFRTLTNNTRISLLQRFGEGVNFLTATQDGKSDAVKNRAGKSILLAISREPEGRDLGIGTQFLGPQDVKLTTALQQENAGSVKGGAQAPVVGPDEVSHGMAETELASHPPPPSAANSQTPETPAAPQPDPAPSSPDPG